MVLAAGRGARMGALTANCPKPLLRVAGRPLIEHQLMALRQADFSEVVVNLGYLGGQIREYLGNGQRLGLRIAYSDEGWPALETGGGIANALPLLGESPFAVVNSDVWCNLDYARLRDLADALDADLAHLLMVDNPTHNPQGDFALEGGRLRVAGGPRLTFAGISVIRPELFRDAPRGAFPLAPLLRQAMDEDRVAGSVLHGLWTDVGTPERRDELELLLGCNARTL